MFRIRIRYSFNGSFFVTYLRTQLDDGIKTKFWQGTWLLKTSLKESFAALFIQSTQQQDLVSYMGWFEGDTWKWTLAWRRHLNDLEQQQYQQLNSMLLQVFLTRDSKDKHIWRTLVKFIVKNLIRKEEAIKYQDAKVDNLGHFRYKGHFM